MNSINTLIISGILIALAFVVAAVNMSFMAKGNMEKRNFNIHLACIVVMALSSLSAAGSLIWIALKYLKIV